RLTVSPSHRLTVSPSHRLTVSPSHRLTVSPSHRLTVSPPPPHPFPPSGYTAAPLRRPVSPLVALAPPAWPSSPAPAPDTAAVSDPRGLKIFKGTDGGRAEWGEVVASAASADAVLVGENHSHPVGLPSAAALWEDVVKRSPNAALAMEFFDRD